MYRHMEAWRSKVNPRYHSLFFFLRQGNLGLEPGCLAPEPQGSFCQPLLSTVATTLSFLDELGDLNPDPHVHRVSVTD